MKSTSGYGVNGFRFGDDVKTRPTEDTRTMEAAASGCPTSSMTLSSLLDTCGQLETLATHISGDLKSTASTTTATTNGGTSGGQLVPNRTATRDSHHMSTTMENTLSSGNSSSVTARLVTHVLATCVIKVSRWTRLLEGRAAVRGGRTGVPVYDVIEAGPRHRFLAGSVVCSNCTLGLGYGMGAVKFVDACKSQGIEMQSAPVEEWPDFSRMGWLISMLRSSAGIHGDLFAPENRTKVGQIVKSLSIVKAWRQANVKIVSRWEKYATDFRLRAAAGKKTYAIMLPSGRIKRYYDPVLAKEPMVEVDENGIRHPSTRLAMKATVVRGKPPVFLTGGKIMENVVQASCRDVMTWGCLEITERHPNWRFKFSVYDEVIFEVPEAECDEAKAEIPRIMCHGERIAPWRQGLPLEVEGEVCDRYCK